MYIDKIKLSYIQACIKQGKATEKGNYKVANRQYKIINKNYLLLHKAGEEGIRTLQGLLLHEEDYVKLWAASHIISMNEYEAKKILQYLSNKSGFLGITALMTLKEWEKITYRKK